MPDLICLREKLWTRTYSIRDQVPTCPVFTRAKIKSRFGILVNLPSHQHQLVVFQWSLSDSKSPQVSRILITILVNFNNSVVWIVSSDFEPFQPLLAFKDHSKCTNYNWYHYHLNHFSVDYYYYYYYRSCEFFTPVLTGDLLLKFKWQLVSTGLKTKAVIDWKSQ